MASIRRPIRNSSSESSGRVSSSEDDGPSTTVGKLLMNKPSELTLKDEEDTITYQPPLPEDYGKKNIFERIVFYSSRRTR
jgi:hypothetical protein